MATFKSFKYDKGVIPKIIRAVSNYCDVEHMDYSDIETIFLTGGCLNLARSDGANNLRRKLVSRMNE